MEKKPTFKNLIDVDSEKLARDRSRSKSPNDRSINRSLNNSNNRSRHKNKRQTNNTSKIHASTMNNFSDVSSTSQPPNQQFKKKPSPQIPRQDFYSNPHQQMVQEISNKMNCLQRSFQKLEGKLNSMFQEVPVTERFRNEQTQILSQSPTCFVQRAKILDQKLDRPVFVVHEVEQQLVSKIQNMNRSYNQQGGLRTISDFCAKHDYGRGQLKLQELFQKLQRLESL